ncbi:MAG: hypothetical protein L0I76_11815 [Pseudonocardia sp.]|nr:hypothetical protein [Pseudonocardia sp.]
MHLSVFSAEPGGDVEGVLHDLLEAGTALGGLLSGEHGVGGARPHASPS